MEECKLPTYAINKQTGNLAADILKATLQRIVNIKISKVNLINKQNWIFTDRKNYYELDNLRDKIRKYSN